MRINLLNLCLPINKHSKLIINQKISDIFLKFQFVWKQNSLVRDEQTNVEKFTATFSTCVLPSSFCSNWLLIKLSCVFCHTQWKKSDRNCKSKQTRKTSRSKINKLNEVICRWRMNSLYHHSMYYIKHDISFKWRIKHSQVVKSSSSNCQKTISVFSPK